MINNKAEESSEFEIVVSVKAKSEIWQHCKFVKYEVSKTKISCRHCHIELKYSGNISNLSDNLTRKHLAVSFFFFFCNQHFLLFPQPMLALLKSLTLIVSII